MLMKEVWPYLPPCSYAFALVVAAVKDAVLLMITFLAMRAEAEDVAMSLFLLDSSLALKEPRSEFIFNCFPGVVVLLFFR